MRTLGKITAVFGVAGAVLAAVIGVQSIPDIKKYLRARAM